MAQIKRTLIAIDFTGRSLRTLEVAMHGITNEKQVMETMRRMGLAGGPSGWAQSARDLLNRNQHRHRT